MNNSTNDLVSDGIVYTCGRCAMFYYEYKQLVAHLYWRHGTESHWCKKCGLKRWKYAAHLCNVLPTEGTTEDSEVNTVYCFCGKDDEEDSMIGCDAPECVLQWFHFKCVGVVVPPDGNWFCPECRRSWATKTETQGEMET